MAKAYDKFGGGRARAGRPASAFVKSEPRKTLPRGYAEIVTGRNAPEIKPGMKVEVVAKHPNGRYIIRATDGTLTKGRAVYGAYTRETARKVARVLARRQAAEIADARQQDGEEIIERVLDWAGDEAEARKWFRSFPIPAFGGRTAESLVETGKAKAVRRYLDAVAVGAFS